MSEICVIPTFQREELLFLCLEAIRREDTTIPIHVFSDRGYSSADLETTCKKFNAFLKIQHDTQGYGNSWNVIEALKDGVKAGHSIVHLIEDDVILHRGYFEWAKEELAKGRACVCARIAASRIENWYESPCASWNAECLRQALALVPQGYFADTREQMQILLDAAFPKSRYKRGGCEQDGLLLRCVEHFGWKTKFPPKPLATHLGAWGYNRPSNKPPTGTFEERIEFTRALLKDKRKRVELFGQSITEKELEGANQ